MEWNARRACRLRDVCISVWPMCELFLVVSTGHIHVVTLRRQSVRVRRDLWSKFHMCNMHSCMSGFVALPLHFMPFCLLLRSPCFPSFPFPFICSQSFLTIFSSKACRFGGEKHPEPVAWCASNDVTPVSTCPCFRVRSGSCANGSLCSPVYMDRPARDCQKSARVVCHIS